MHIIYHNTSIITKYLQKYTYKANPCLTQITYQESINQTDRDKDNYIPCQPPLEFAPENMMLDKDRAAENRKKILLA